MTAPPPPFVAERKWLGPRGAWWLLLFGGSLLMLYVVVGAIFGPHRTEYRTLPTDTIALGSILAAVCVFYAMLYRLRAQDGVSVPLLFGALGTAAFVTTFAAGEINGAIARAALAAHLPGSGNPIGVISGLFAGPVEETLKGLTVLFLGLAVGIKTLRGGLFLGGAVGLGFAASENLQYFTAAWEHPILQLSQIGTLTLAIGFRTILTPLLHPIFTALIGGALFATARNNRYRLGLPLVGTYFAVVGVHSLWDSLSIGLSQLKDSLSRVELGALSLLVLVILLAIAIGLPFVWRTVARRADVLAGYRPPKAPRLQQPLTELSEPSGPPEPSGTSVRVDDVERQ